MRVIAAMGPALQQAHDASLTAGRCAASSEAFSRAVSDIERSVPATKAQFCHNFLPPQHCRQRSRDRQLALTQLPPSHGEPGDYVKPEMPPAPALPNCASYTEERNIRLHQVPIAAIAVPHSPNSLCSVSSRGVRPDPTPQTLPSSR